MGSDTGHSEPILEYGLNMVDPKYGKKRPRF